MNTAFLYAQHKSSSVTNHEVLWGESNNQTIKLITLVNKNGMEVRITNYGGTITYIGVPDNNGKIENIVLRFDNLNSYLGDHPYFGGLIGRYANRIGGAQFSLDGKIYKLAANDWANALHGGPGGFHKKVLDIDGVYTTQDSAIIALSFNSPDMEEGYPGNLKVKVTYTLTNDNEIKIQYEAETDQTTVINLTNHSYFNHSSCKETILNHELFLAADSITPTDETLMPTGKLQTVAGTAFDFTRPHKIGERIPAVPGGYDINYVLQKENNKNALAAEV